MKVLQLDQTTLKLLGVISSRGKPYYTRMLISQCVCLVAPIALLIPLVAFFLCNLDDIAQATSAFYLMCITGMALITYWEFWIKRSEVLSIIHDIQQIINDSTDDYKPMYGKTIVLAYKIVHYFRIFAFFSIYGVVSLPLCLIIFVWISGGNVVDMRILPVSLL